MPFNLNKEKIVLKTKISIIKLYSCAKLLTKGYINTSQSFSVLTYTVNTPDQEKTHCSREINAYIPNFTNWIILSFSV